MIDIVIFIALAVGIIRGGMQGFIKQLSSVLGLIVGLVAAKRLYTPLAEKLCPTMTDSMTIAQILAFIAIWIAIPLLFALVASLLTKAFEVISLGWLNRFLGSLLGALKYLLIASLVIFAIEFFDSENKIIKQTKKSESLFYYKLEDFTGIFFPAAKQITQQYILNT